MPATSEVVPLRPSPNANHFHELRSIALALLIFAALSLFFAVRSDGFLTADALSHYLYAKYAFRNPHYFVDVWGRPFCTALYAFPAAAGGLLAVRATSCLLAVACALATWRVARRLDYRGPELAAVFVLAQPLVFFHSFSEMTELPFATLLAFAFWAYVARRFAMMALLVALTPLARPEGFGFLALAGLALIAHRKPWPLLLLPLPLVLWNHAGWQLDGRAGAWWRWLPDHWPYATDSLYPPGHLLTFVALLPAVVSPLLFPFTLIGGGLSLREARRVAPDTADAAAAHRRRCRALASVLPLLILTGHSLLYWTGKLGSFGEARYLLVVAPFWGLLSARGWEWAWDRFRWRHATRWAAAASLAPLLVNVFHPLLPLHPPTHWGVARLFAENHRAGLVRQGYGRVLAAHPAVFYYLDVDPKDAARTAEWSKATVAAAPAGTILVWDPIYADRNADARRAVTVEEIVKAGWEPVPDVDASLNAGAERGRGGHVAPDERADGEPDVPWRVFRSGRAGS